VLLALAVLSLGGCGSCGSKSEKDAGADAADALTPIPAPAGHVGDFFVANPGATWTKVRSTLGQPALFLPQSFGALATVLIGLPITLSAEVDEAVAVVGAAARHGRGPLQGAVAIHVKAGDRFVDQVTRGQGARFNATLDPATRITLLTDKIAPESQKVALGVLGNYLILAQKTADLYALGPYVVRTLGAAAAPKEDVVVDVPERALAGSVREAVRALRDEVASAAVTVLPITGMLDTASELLGDSQGARFVVSFEADGVHGRGTLTPTVGGGAGSKVLADLAVGDARPILDLPDTTTAALLWREGATTRAENVPNQAEGLARLLGAEVTAEEKAAISSALRAEAAARGDWQAIGVAFNGTGPTAVVRAPVTDPDQMRKALKQLVDLAALPSVKKALTTLGIKLVVEKAVVENLTAEVTRVRLARADEGDVGAPSDAKAKTDPKPRVGDKKPVTAPRGETPKAVDLLYFVDGAGVFAAAGFDPKDSLRALTKAPAGPNLASIAPMASMLSVVGNEAAFVLVADLLRINAMTSGTVPPSTPMPLVLAAGRSGASGTAQLWGRFDVPTRVVEEVVAELMRRKTSGP
jgi:hypothetical protein